MAGMRFGIVADDNTGASDAAGMLSERGVRTALVLGLDDLDNAGALMDGFDAVVLGTQIRSVEPDLAATRTRASIEQLMALGIRKLQLKYCSTFDSTPEGNIGCSLDAGLDVTGQGITIVAPALPVNGRTTYNGYHFVDGVPLSESPLRHHPLNPMTDSNLVRWLQLQTERKVDVLRLDDVRRGPEHVREVMASLAESGVSYVVTDALCQADLQVVAEATSDWAFISGGSGITAEIPALMFPGREPLVFTERIAALRPGGLVVSGSMSPATRAQKAFALANGFAGLPVEPRAVLDDALDIDSLVAGARKLLADGAPLIVYSAADSSDDVRRTQEYGRALGLSVTEVGERIAFALAEVAGRLVKEGRVGRLVISGGETSGAVCARVGLGVLEVGLPVDPGVPYCFPASHPELMVVLKSGNFGSEDFYIRVMNQQ
jgi:3-dehydrotetronate 4-kinase